MTADCAAKQRDGSYRAVADSYCDNHRSSGGHGGGGFVWIYGGSHASNGTVTGGTLTRPQNTNISSRSGRVIVGGFGGNAKGGGGS
ncbi:hypothetical protein [Sphaerimonospora mesophila]|uniref:hypothetical protein n=1 Tax=Sphaerimonospora mesophila TaxID=37483 RepID=UPI00128FB3AE